MISYSQIFLLWARNGYRPSLEEKLNAYKRMCVRAGRSLRAQLARPPAAEARRAGDWPQDTFWTHQ